MQYKKKNEKIRQREGFHMSVRLSSLNPKYSQAMADTLVKEIDVPYLNQQVELRVSFPNTTRFRS